MATARDAFQLIVQIFPVLEDGYKEQGSSPLVQVQRWELKLS